MKAVLALTLIIALFVSSCLGTGPKILGEDTASKISALEVELNAPGTSEPRKAEIEAEITDLIENGLQEEYGYVSTILSMVGLPSAIGDQWAWLAAFLFKRPRRQGKSGLKKFGNGDIKGGLKDFVSILGLTDSTEGSSRLMS